jgi:hypothetical protein
MSVNRDRNYLLVLTEDSAYQSLLNGVKKADNINSSVLDIRKPCGGWPKVFDSFESNGMVLLNKKPKTTYILLLIDFDDKTEEGNENFSNRMKRFKDLSKEYADHVFLLGVNHKEAEALKKFFAQSSLESIGQMLVENCPNSDLSYWKNKHLQCNLIEINRMRKCGIFDWIFMRQAK